MLSRCTANQWLIERDGHGGAYCCFVGTSGVHIVVLYRWSHWVPLHVSSTNHHDRSRVVFVCSMTILYTRMMGQSILPIDCRLHLSSIDPSFAVVFANVRTIADHTSLLPIIMIALMLGLFAPSPSDRSIDQSIDQFNPLINPFLFALSLLHASNAANNIYLCGLRLNFHSSDSIDRTHLSSTNHCDSSLAVFVTLFVQSVNLLF